jgi:predicted small secreted protein
MKLILGRHLRCVNDLFLLLLRPPDAIGRFWHRSGTNSALLVFNNIRADWRLTMRQLIIATLMLVLLMTSAACNTIHGFGRDVERVGEETQDAANSVRRRL